MKFPHECCRCGMCCITSQCPISIEIYGIVNGVCPALSFEHYIASCKHAGLIVPIGDGCCIKAKAYKNGIEYDFASLPEEYKYIAVQQMKGIK